MSHKLEETREKLIDTSKDEKLVRTLIVGDEYVDLNEIFDESGITLIQGGLNLMLAKCIEIDDQEKIIELEHLIDFIEEST